MARVWCPECEAELEVADEDLGEPMACGACGASFTARAGRRRPRYDEDDEDDDDRPRRRRRYRDDPEELVDEARRAVFLPGLFAVLVSALGILLAGLEIVLIVAMPQAVQGNPFLGNMPPGVLIGIRVAAIGWESVILAGASAMMRLRSYQFARVAMVMRVIPFAGFCCILGFPFGIWGLVTLNRPEVRDGFEEARRERERGTRTPRAREDRGYDDEDEDR
jgi:hypothetical protein